MRSGRCRRNIARKSHVRTFPDYTFYTSYMWRLISRPGLFITCLAASSLLPSRADAQWYFAGYLGVNHTQPADVRVAQPASGLDLTYADVTFDAKPFQSPQYYGWRLGRTIGASDRFGVELEFTHLKVIAETDRSYMTTGRTTELSIVANPSRMDTLVQRYAMSHGLNFILVNFVSRTPIGPTDGRAALVIRGGAGPTLPHAETSVLHQEREQYEWAGLGVHGAAGLEILLHGRWSMVVDYKLTYAKPTISIANGTGQTTALTHQVAAGIKIAVPRH